MSITAANAVLILSVRDNAGAPILPATRIQQFSTDDVYDVPAIKTAETQMGVDGNLAAGFIYVEIPQTYTLMADSPSNNFFDAWRLQELAAVEKFRATGQIALPGISTKFNQVQGVLNDFVPVPQGKKVLQARHFVVVWQSIFPAPI